LIKKRELTQRRGERYEENNIIKSFSLRRCAAARKITDLIE
jgi:hypothetical protein